MKIFAVVQLYTSIHRDEKLVSPQPTKYYYFNEAHTIYYGNGVEFTFFKDMGRFPYKEVEKEVERLNRQSGFIAPVDDDYCDEEG